MLDLSDGALDVARINVDRFELWDRVSPISSDLFSALYEQEQKPQYQLIVSNPPYVDEEDMSDLPDEFHHEPEMGLEAGNDGLNFARRILAQAGDFLTDDGLLVVEVGNSQWALDGAFPEVPFTWIEFEHGGHGVFAITAAELKQHRSRFV